MQSRPQCSFLAFASAVLALVPNVASAHLVTTGLGPIYDGIWHVLVSPFDILVVVAVSLVAGLGSTKIGRGIVLVFPSVWSVAAFTGLWLQGPALPDIVTNLILVGLGLQIALDWRLAFRVVSSMAIVVGAVQGFGDGVAIAQEGGEAIALLGMAVSLLVICSIATGLAVWGAQGVGRTVVRTGGSWIAAVALLTAGWSLRSFLGGL